MTHPKDLRTRRLALGLSLAEVARLLGIAPGLVGRWERGEAPIEDPETVFARLDEIAKRRKPKPEKA